jgi:hypothetical protein
MKDNQAGGCKRRRGSMKEIGRTSGQAKNNSKINRHVAGQSLVGVVLSAIQQVRMTMLVLSFVCSFSCHH